MKRIYIGVILLVFVLGAVVYIQFLSPSRVLALAGEAFNKGQYDNAILIYKIGLIIQPNSPDLLSGIIRSYAAQGNRTGTESDAAALAQPYVQRALSLAEERETLISAGYIEEIAGNYREALNYYQKAVELDTTQARPWFHLGHAYEFLAERELAQQMYDQAFELDQNDPRILIIKGRQAMIQKDQASALEFFGRAVKYADGVAVKAEALTALSAIKRNQGFLEEAKGLATAALLTDSSYAPALVAYGMSLSLEGKPQEAVKFIQDATAVNPRMVQPYLALGIVLRVAKETGQAIDFLTQGLEKIANDNTLLGPQAQQAARAQLTYELAKTYSMKGDDEQALSLLEQAIQLDSGLRAFLASDVRDNGFFSTLSPNSRFQALMR